MTCRTAKAALLAALTAPVLSAAAQVQYEARYVAGPAAPGGDPAVTISGLGTPVINQHGRMVFLMRVAGPGITRDANDVWVVTDRNGPLEVIARTGDVHPDTGGHGVLYFIGANINGDGTVAVHAVLDSGAESVIWRDAGNGLEKLLSSLDPPPIPETGSSFGAVIGTLDGPVLNDHGQSAFYTEFEGSLITTDNDAAILATAPGGLAVVLREGDPPPVLDPAVQYIGPIGVTLTSLNNAGQTVFSSTVGVNPLITAVWRGGPQGIDLVARTGDPIPNLPDVAFSFLYLPSGNLNNEGHFAFYAGLQGAGVTTADGSAIFAASSSGIRTVARRGDPIPNEPGATFSPLSLWVPAVNGLGEVALVGSTVTATNVSSRTVFREVEGQLQTIAKVGDPAVGMGSQDFFESFRVLFFNDLGAVVFGAVVNDSSPFTDREDGYWFRTAAGELAPLLVAGQQIQLGGGLTQTVETPFSEFFSSPTTRAGNSGQPTLFNNANQFAAAVRFVGAPTAIVVATIGEPCLCELDGASGIDVFDLLAYLDLWFQLDPAAERTGDEPANIDVFDLLAFLDCWFAALC